MRILFLATNGELEASTRYRVLQYFPALRACGHEPELKTFFAGTSEAGRKLARVARGVWGRINAFAALDDYDVVVIHRELLPFSLNYGVKRLGRRSAIVFDFDDAVFLPGRSGWRGLLSAPRSTAEIAAAARVVLAGNSFLADWARARCRDVEVLPTVVDTGVYRPRARDGEQERPLVVGWIGSPTTAQYLASLWPILDELARSFDFRVRVIGAGRTPPPLRAPVETPPWRADSEAAEFAALDVGLYPLTDDDWARGKCGFKAIQYLAAGVAAVVSPVGVVREIVRDGVDGLWAESPSRWRDAIASLLESAAERRRLAVAGRQRIESAYSLHTATPRLIGALERARGSR